MEVTGTLVLANKGLGRSLRSVRGGAPETTNTINFDSNERKIDATTHGDSNTTSKKKSKGGYHKDSRGGASYRSSRGPFFILCTVSTGLAQVCAV